MIASHPSSTFRICIERTGETFEQQPGDTVLRAAQRAGVGFPYECSSGGCGTCRFQVRDGHVDDRWPDAPARSDRDRRTGRLLGCQCSATSNLVVDVRTGDEYVPGVRPVRSEARLREVEDLTHDMRRFVFSADRPSPFLPGQYAVLALPGVPSTRCYSMSNVADDSGTFEFIVRRVRNGVGTRALFDLEPGTRVEIDAPYGLAWLRSDNNRDIVCVAGGSGLAPMLAIARAAYAEHLLDTRLLHFFHGVRTVDDLCAEALLGALGTGRIVYHPVLSEPPADGSWSGATGFVHEAACRLVPGPLSDHEWYFAGPPPMTQAMQNALAVEQLVPVSQLHHDRFA